MKPETRVLAIYRCGQGYLLASYRSSTLEELAYSPAPSMLARTIQSMKTFGELRYVASTDAGAALMAATAGLRWLGGPASLIFMMSRRQTLYILCCLYTGSIRNISANALTICLPGSPLHW